MKITEPSALYDLDEAVYHADQLCPEPSLSSTMAKTIVSPGGPAKLHELMHGERARKAAWDFGTAAHSKILGRGQEVAVIDGNRNAKVVKEAIAEAEAAGLIVLKSEDAVAVDRMADAILAHPLAAELLTAGHGKPEVSMFGTDEATGRWARGRLDFLHSRELIVDFKTCAAADRSGFERSAWSFGYHIQAAHYLRLAKQLDLVDDDCAYVLIAAEKSAPHLVAVYQLDGDLIEYGDQLVGLAFERWDRCLTLGDWPGLPPVITTIGLPKWATNEGDLND